jgi:NAD(P)-dependent dehydrogenase (short-subunit alcohol dehydrogenase family)
VYYIIVWRFAGKKFTYGRLDQKENALLMDRFQGKVVIVTGGSRGIGLAACQSFALEGARVVIASIHEERGQKAVDKLKEMGAEAVFTQTDVTQQDQVERLTIDTLERFGDIHVLVNNAAVHGKASFWEESEDLWERMFKVNIMGTVLPSQSVVKNTMKYKGGAIVHVASKAGVVGEPGHAAYSSSKGAILALTRAMAIELAPYGIRVNAISPGPVYTEMFTDNVTREEDRKRIAESAPLGRIGLPEDIARGILFLASNDSDWCTGQSLSVDGGLSILK